MMKFESFVPRIEDRNERARKAGLSFLMSFDDIDYEYVHIDVTPISAILPLQKISVQVTFFCKSSTYVLNFSFFIEEDIEEMSSEIDKFHVKGMFKRIGTNVFEPIDKPKFKEETDRASLCKKVARDTFNFVEEEFYIIENREQLERMLSENLSNYFR